MWVALVRLWPEWRKVLMLAKPETVIGWHRRGFRFYWKWKSRRGRIRRPGASKEIRELIRDMSSANVLWGAPRLHGELLKLGIDVSQATVAKYMQKHRKPPSQTWRTFLENHVKQLVSLDRFVVPTACFRILYVFLVLAHERRRVVVFQRDRASDCRVDGGAADAGIPLGHGAAVHASGRLIRLSTRDLPMFFRNWA